MKSMFYVRSALVIMAALLALPVHAGFEYRIQQVGTVTSDGVNPTTGSFNVLVRLTAPDSGNANTSVGYTTSYQLDAGATAAGITLSAATYVPPASGGINFPSGSFVGSINGTQTRSAASNDSAAAVSYVDGAVLGNIKFTAPVGYAGTFNVTPSGGGLNEFLNGAGNPVPLTTFAGSITVGVSAVPEPATMGLVGLALVGGVGAARRRFAKRAK